ncbi:16S rRNA (guanine(527)-N(7))-methyltransferase RsmG [Stakelama tenebrarum]|uniref:Ribosomal RNA small subunit methyltransferase G n=1 Tax=Stakelama tenebrarum TaxID=2711215 RepID=A0A6G6Y1U6_9SPHN|nr:16S rRNA (guanine(527)-N(7))-methyltransferase RsmG [Sphingosinithalassobacter tenebrarum]QIG78546.1 16S rRNA (guanine(527)-N(7))-methyltransferase RsmG [Sphingosinithalassobacter tenebrarum]
MTEDEARAWIAARWDVSRGTMLSRFAELLIEETGQQNLISASTVPSLWVRHIVDSAQLALCTEHAGTGEWIDIGTGAGLPGLVVAILDSRRRFTLVEPRAKRVAFLDRCIETLGLADRVTVVASRIERHRLSRPAAVISARAVAALPDLFSAARHCADRNTLWLLPKGRNAQSEVEAARLTWQGSFHVEQSITDPESGIVVAREVRPR